MKRKTIAIQDPDLGLIELPDDPPMSPEAANRLRERIRRQYQKQQRYRPGVHRYCTDCRTETVEYATDLSATMKQGRNLAMFRNLRGGRCTTCGGEYIETSELIRIEDEAEILMGAPEPARVTSIGRGTLGTYWPKPIERGLKLRAGDRFQVKMLGPSTALLEVLRPARKSGDHAPKKRTIKG